MDCCHILLHDPNSCSLLLSSDLEIKVMADFQTCRETSLGQDLELIRFGNLDLIFKVSTGEMAEYLISCIQSS